MVSYAGRRGKQRPGTSTFCSPQCGTCRPCPYLHSHQFPKRGTVCFCSLSCWLNTVLPQRCLGTTSEWMNEWMNWNYLTVVERELSALEAMLRSCIQPLHSWGRRSWCAPVSDTWFSRPHRLRACVWVSADQTAWMWHEAELIWIEASTLESEAASLFLFWTIYPVNI